MAYNQFGGGMMGGAAPMGRQMFGKNRRPAAPMPGGGPPMQAMGGGVAPSGAMPGMAPQPSGLATSQAGNDAWGTSPVTPQNTEQDHATVMPRNPAAASQAGNNAWGTAPTNTATGAGRVLDENTMLGHSADMAQNNVTAQNPQGQAGGFLGAVNPMLFGGGQQQANQAQANQTSTGLLGKVNPMLFGGPQGNKGRYQMSPQEQADYQRQGQSKENQEWKNLTEDQRQQYDDATKQRMGRQINAEQEESNRAQYMRSQGDANRAAQAMQRPAYGQTRQTPSMQESIAAAMDQQSRRPGAGGPAQGATAAQLAENAMPIPGVTQTPVPGGPAAPPPATAAPSPAAQAAFTGNAPAAGSPEYSQGTREQKKLWDLAGSMANPMNKAMWSNPDVMANIKKQLTPEQYAAALEFSKGAGGMQRPSDFNAKYG